MTDVTGKETPRRTNIILFFQADTFRKLRDQAHKSQISIDDLINGRLGGILATFCHKDNLCEELSRLLKAHANTSWSSSLSVSIDLTLSVRFTDAVPAPYRTNLAISVLLLKYF